MNGYGIDVISLPYQLMALRKRFIVRRCDRNSRVNATKSVSAGIPTADNRIKTV
jgi:hypothetical protein